MREERRLQQVPFLSVSSTSQSQTRVISFLSGASAKFHLCRFLGKACSSGRIKSWSGIKVPRSCCVLPSVLLSRKIVSAVSALGSVILRKQTVKENVSLRTWLWQQQRKKEGRRNRRSWGAVTAEVQLLDHSDCEKQPGSTDAQQVVGNALQPA